MDIPKVSMLNQLNCIVDHNKIPDAFQCDESGVLVPMSIIVWEGMYFF